MQNTALQLVLQAGYIVKLVLLVLVFFSVMSWAIILYKWSYFSKARRENEEFIRLLAGSKDVLALKKASRSLRISPIANTFNLVSSERFLTDIDAVKRSIKRHSGTEINRLESYLGFLATTGSTTPFIGLFGTVWGIMNAFRGIGAAGSASLAIVAPGIAEALIATAVGLAAAIPAVIAYNFFLSSTRRMTMELDDYSEELIVVFSRGGE